MVVSQRDIKLLWGRAQGRCSFPDCRIKLSQDKNITSDSFPFGEQAHIVGESKNAPRGKSLLSQKERNSYFNLILLCPTHHAIIDDNPEDYPIERLHLIKDQHELWVEQTLSENKDLRKTAQDVIYADLIDAAAESCQFESWDKWASRATGPDMNWDADAQERIFKFYNKILGAVWPNALSELEYALKTLASLMHEAIETFVQHCEIKNGKLFEERFYKIREWNPTEYNRLFKEYDVWHDKCDKLVIEATKAANWLAEVVRRDINPLFFATKGKFFIIMGPFTMLEFRSYFFEYTEAEKKRILLKDNRKLIGKRFAKNRERNA